MCQDDVAQLCSQAKVAKQLAGRSVGRRRQPRLCCRHSRVSLALGAQQTKGEMDLGAQRGTRQEQRPTSRTLPSLGMEGQVFLSLSPRKSPPTCSDTSPKTHTLHPEDKPGASLFSRKQLRSLPLGPAQPILQL